MKRKLTKKNKKKRGFTLIELLAVILILGIIVLIAIPTVSSVVEQSRKGAAEQSVVAFVKAVEEKTISKDLAGEKIPDGDYLLTEILDLGLDIKGTIPDSGYITIKGNDVTNCQLLVNGYVINCGSSEGKKENVVDKIDTNSFTLAENSSYLGMVYYNPNEGKKCTRADFDANLASYDTSEIDSNGDKFQGDLNEGCMIWYIYKDNGDDTINMILNHNISNAQKHSLSTLSSFTSDWKNTADFMSVVDFAKIIKADIYYDFDISKKFFIPQIGYNNMEKYSSDINSNITLQYLFETSNEKDVYRYFWLMENLLKDDESQKYLSKVSSQKVLGAGPILNYPIGYFLKEKIEFVDNVDNDYYWTFGGGIVYDSGVIRSFFSKKFLGPSSQNGFRPVITVDKKVFE